MTVRNTVVSLVAALVVVSVLTPAVAWTAGAQEDGTEASGLVVESLEATPSVTPNASVDVNATITNPTDEEVTEDVAFRLAGNDRDVVVRQSVTLAANESTTVSMTYDTGGFDTGDYIHGVTTANSSMFATLEVTTEADVSFAAHETNGTEVVVDSAFLPEGGYVTIHDATLLEGDAIGSVVGVSEYLEPGYHDNVTVTLYDDVPGANFTESELTESQLLIAMPHMETSGAMADNATEVGDDGTDENETDGNETAEPSGEMTYDFVSTNGTEDGPYTEDGEAITVSAPVTLADEAGDDADANETDDETVGNETDANETVGTETDADDTNGTETATDEEAVSDDEPADDETVGTETAENETVGTENGTETVGTDTADNETVGNETSVTETAEDDSPLLGPLWRN
ncbi:DUF7282 domain-containing protein [Halorarum halobium]|uniref:DUF7282 domain-containing protein n=1 Tax=Halorarum halobium TaxID=3075121 RepID=UPI0028AC16A3|nr:hypothetical protein [Halobaculum sp. XH14]